MSRKRPVDVTRTDAEREGDANSTRKVNQRTEIAAVRYSGTGIALLEDRTGVMFLCINNTAYEVATFEHASRMFCAARDKFGEGASNTPAPFIVDHTGSVVAHVSYNGRVWPAAHWTESAKPLYDNRSA
ncbi:hypothetical protein JJE66_26640 [Bradyrhizobium diazoefficiens]|uniref:hypothetical protein n=1 Tax=Bradyrhizobium diazoefficiens TaxID=1355477 RepID=UPI00190C80B3|nr:hypothetical protein [Bradyrhizobium diazoefficiens]MBK3664792.1 hypothetical protein [Bradyrhizobium diazoefficiens]